VDVSFKDDVTVILLLGVSFMLSVQETAISSNSSKRGEGLFQRYIEITHDPLLCSVAQGIF
jgi:hypothetical protein